MLIVEEAVGRRVYGKSLEIPLSFAVNLKLLYKTKFINKNIDNFMMSVAENLIKHRTLLIRKVCATAQFVHT